MDYPNNFYGQKKLPGTWVPLYKVFQGQTTILKFSENLRALPEWFARKQIIVKMAFWHPKPQDM